MLEYAELLLQLGRVANAREIFYGLGGQKDSEKAKAERPRSRLQADIESGRSRRGSALVGGGGHHDAEIRGQATCREGCDGASRLVVRDAADRTGNGSESLKFSLK